MCGRFAALLLAASLSGGQTARAQTAFAVAGTVATIQGGERAAVARATVVVRPAGSREVLGSVRADEQGRYRIEGLTVGRLEAEASRTGFLGRKLVVDCTQGNACSQVEFELVKAAAAAGQVVDESGEPLERIEVKLSRAGSAQGEAAARATDDRGRFRIGNLAPGEYVLEASQEFRIASEPAYSAEPMRVKLEAGEAAELRVVMRLENSFRVAGKVRAPADVLKGGATIEMRRSAAGIQGPVRAALGVDGSFLLWPVNAGDYEAQLVKPGARPVRLSTVRVDRDIAGLSLEAAPLGGVRGLVVRERGVPPGAIHLLLSAGAGGEARALSASAPGYRFEALDLAPGEYRARAMSQAYYVKAGGEVRVGEGEVKELRIVVAADYGVLRGRVDAANSRVALSGEGGVRTVLADQMGRFEFERVIPGVYRVAAWRRAGEEDVQSDGAWQAAGEKVKTVRVGPMGAVEVELGVIE